MGNMKSEKRFRWWLWGIVAAALSLRILCALPALTQGGDLLLRPDSHTYILPAKALLADGAYLESPGSAVPATLRPPGYPCLLAVSFSVFGEILVIPALLGCLVSALACYPVGLCGRFFAGRTGGLIAAAFYALNLTSIAAGPLILADSVLGLLCAWLLYYVLRAWRERSLGCFAAACVLLALGAFFKPINTPVFLLAMPVLAPVFFGFSRKTFYAWGTVLLVFSVLLFPWMLRNYRAGADFDMDSNRGEMYYHSGSAILSAATHENSDILRERMRRNSEAFLAEHPDDFPNVRAKNAWKNARYMDLIRNHPVAFLQTHLPQYAMLLPDLPTFLENNALSVSGRGTLAVLREQGVYAALNHYLDGRLILLAPALPFLAVMVLLYLFAAWTLLLWLIKWKWRLGLIFGAFAFFYLFAGGPVTMPRYQIPALPFLCAMAAFGVVFLFRIGREFRHRRNRKPLPLYDI